MSLHIAAQHLASKGRDGDTELVHMTKGEVKGLHALALAHGGSLTTNPHTGLTEASWLKNILPAIAGVALTGLSFGAINPLTAGMITGGFETLRTGDLSKGLLAGLGAYGGAGLGEMAGIGASAAPTASAGTGTGISTAGNAGAGTSVTPTASGGLNAAPSSVGLNAGTNAASSGAGLNVGASTPGITAPANSLYAPNLSAPPTNYMSMAKYGMSAAAPVLSDAAQPNVPGVEEYDGPLNKYRLSPNFQAAPPVRPNPYYRPVGLGYAEGGNVNESGEYTPNDYDEGGIAAFAPGGLLPSPMRMGEGIYRDSDEDTASKNAYAATQTRLKKLNKAANMPKSYGIAGVNVDDLGTIKAAKGGQLGGYSDGGRMLKGPGDGMSDSIPAIIGKKQPARLADGEFVVPADVVSHLGNGSTDAGAKKLYGMMDKVRHARTGKKKQAPAVNTNKFIPK